MRFYGTLSTAAAALVAAAAFASAGVYDDVAAWWHLDWADSGAASAGQIRDQRTWGGSGAHVATGIQGSPAWTTTVAPAGGPAGGQTYGERSLSFTPVAGAPDGFNVSGLQIGGDATVVSRFRFDGYVDPGGQPTAQIHWNGFNWSANQGWLWRLVGANQNPHLYIGNGSSQVQSPISINTGSWYDMAVVLDENGANDTLTFYAWEQGGNIQTSSHTGSLFSGAVDTSGTKVGWESLGGNAEKAFNGDMEHHAVWSRALSEADIHEAFGDPGPLWSIGIDNASNDDMRLESQVDADYAIGEPWHEMRRAVTSTVDTANVQFDLSAAQDAPLADLPYMFHLDVHGTAGGNPVDLSVRVNGTNFGTRTVTPGTDHLWFVPAGTLTAGANNLSIQYESGAAYASWDWMELGGAWQVGFDNNSQSEFSQEGTVPDDFYVTDPNWKHLERALTAGQPDTNLHFFLSDELVNNLPEGMAYLYTTEVISQNPSSGNPFDVLLNGGLLGSFPALANNTTISLGLPFSLLQAGENILTLQYQGTSGWTQFDYHRLELMPEPGTLSLLALGGLALVRRRRRRR
jgi:hypothetical protein